MSLPWSQCLHSSRARARAARPAPRAAALHGTANAPPARPAATRPDSVFRSLGVRECVCANVSVSLNLSGCARTPNMPDAERRANRNARARAGARGAARAPRQHALSQECPQSHMVAFVATSYTHAQTDSRSISRSRLYLASVYAHTTVYTQNMCSVFYRHIFFRVTFSREATHGPRTHRLLTSVSTRRPGCTAPMVHRPLSRRAPSQLRLWPKSQLGRCSASSSSDARVCSAMLART